VATPEELATYDATITSIRDSIPALKASHKAKAAQLSQLKSAMTTEDLRQSIAALDAKKKELEGKLEVLKNTQVKPITKEEREVVEESFRYWRRAAVARKRVWNTMEEMFMDLGDTREMVYVSGSFLDMFLFWVVRGVAGSGFVLIWTRCLG
jgi:tryptophan 2,3-dioxygenase